MARTLGRNNSAPVRRSNQLDLPKRFLSVHAVRNRESIHISGLWMLALRPATAGMTDFEFIEHLQYTAGEYKKRKKNSLRQDELHTLLVEQSNRHLNFERGYFAMHRPSIAERN